MKKLFLASASPRRHEILEAMRLPHTVLTAEADESVAEGTEPSVAGELLAARKAFALKEALKKEGRFDGDTLILAADTLVYCDGRALGKPRDEEDAVDMLMRLSGKKHSVCTGTCLIYGERSVSASESSDVYMRAFTETEARAYVGTGEPLDKAGAYGIQGMGAVLIERTDGDFYSVMGLSKRTVARLFGCLGVPYFEFINSENNYGF